MTSRLTEIYAEHALLSRLLDKYRQQSANALQRLASLPISPNLPSDYARALGEYETTKLVVADLTAEHTQLENELKSLQPS